MVCKECGTYNAENLTHCRVCAAKLRDDDAPADEQSSAKDESRPSRDFVKAPSWPTHAFTGAPENQPLTSAGSAAPSGSVRPTIPPRAANAPQAAFCPHCGKPVVSDAPFCPYCGQRVVPDAGAAAYTAAKTAPAAAQGPAKALQTVDDYDDEYDEDEYDDEEEPVSKKQSRKLAKRASRYEDEDDDEDEYDDENEYDDDDEYDDEEFDDMPKKRGKGTTILFWSLIVLLLALIAVFGMFVAKKEPDGYVGQMFAKIGSIFNKSDSDVDTTDTEVVDSSTESAMYTASITEYTDPSTGDVSYNIDIHAPTGSTVRLITNAKLKQDTATISSNDHVILQIARDVFMPNEPCESEVVTITPNIQVVSPEGETTQLTVPEITVTVPTLSMTITTPETDTVNATYDNEPIPIVGQVDDYDSGVAVFINDEQVYVDSTGMFTSSYTPNAAAAAEPTATPAASDDSSATDSAEDTASPSPSADVATDETTDDTTVTDTSEASVETITIEARKNNYVTARKIITVEPYVMQNMVMMISNDTATGLTSTDGSITLSGTVTPDAVITAACSSSDVTFGPATVSATGTFSIAVSIAEVGAYDITLTGKLDGYYDGEAVAIVERSPSDSSTTFKKACSSLADGYDKIVAGTTTSGDFQCTGKVTEIISSSPYTIFRLELSDGNEVICVNRSTKSTINSADLKEKKQVAGTLKGLYTDGTTPYLWCWFIWNK